MIGAFARMLKQRDQVLHCEETEEHQYNVRARSGEVLNESDAKDAPPERFVERYAHDGGDVFIAPLIDTLRAILGRKRQPSEAEPPPAHPSTSVPER